MDSDTFEYDSDDLPSSLGSDSEEDLNGVFIQPGSLSFPNGFGVPELASFVRSRTLGPRALRARAEGLRGGAAAQDESDSKLNDVDPELLDEFDLYDRAIDRITDYLANIVVDDRTPKKAIKTIEEEVKALKTVRRDIEWFATALYGGKAL